MVKINGTTIAISIAIPKANKPPPSVALMAKIPGNPPTPIAFARTPIKLLNILAIPEPIIAATNG